MYNYIHMDTLITPELLNVVGGVICRAEHHNLEAEVILSAMLHLKQFPDASIEEALQVGLDEWDA